MTKENGKNKSTGSGAIFPQFGGAAPEIKSNADIVLVQGFRMGQCVLDNVGLCVTILINEKLPYIVMQDDVAKAMAEQLEKKARKQ